jgi:hypothetical protein
MGKQIDNQDQKKNQQSFIFHPKFARQ